VDEIEYRKMFEVEDTHWWFRGKRAVVGGLIARFAPAAARRRALDVGCGTGANLALLSGFGDAVGVDLHPLALALSRQRGIASVARASALALPFPDARFDVVTMLDVLYHRGVADVAASVREAARVCRPGGLLVITDSAFEFLKGPHDVAYHAARRFRRGELATLVRDGGFTVLRSSYANTLLFPLALTVRLLDRLRFGDRPHSSLGQPSRATNAILGAVYGLEARVLRHTSLPFGLSVLIVARRTTEAPVRGRLG
jgi:SAM-dependent methyltransferase